ncbi:MAG TPA: glycosyltransferase family 2 protein [Flavobacterium sp.]|uniref:glycosyltransferase family 2 protein n=1 Tax=Flavobacterium sp. TaxID=239 RepID=UPI002B4B5E19|nr:glycosyltransferase family 2 protein [Flavobacterium sp.]HLO73749.1 glycosyltransferase family 2 protein [Flavobacterium sp.]
MQPLVSIIIPTFNSSKHIKATLDSVLSQTYTDWECILVDDGSIDLTETISVNYQEKDNRFQLYKRPEDLPKGPSSARNYGVTKAKGEYLIFLDADDLLVSTCLENRVAQFQQNHECDFLVFQMERFLDEPDFSIKEIVVEQDKNRVLESFIQLHGQWPITSPIYKTNFFKTIHFNTSLVVFEDLEVAIKAIVQAIDFHVFNTIDCYYRNDSNYQTKYNSLEIKTKMVKSFQTLLLSVVELVRQNSEKQFKNQDIKSYFIQSYKKIFRFQILENIEAFKEDNKKIVHLLAAYGFLDSKTAFKFFLVDRVLLPFASIKGSGIARLIKKIYN